MRMIDVTEPAEWSMASNNFGHQKIVHFHRAYLAAVGDASNGAASSSESSSAGSSAAMSAAAAAR